MVNQPVMVSQEDGLCHVDDMFAIGPKGTSKRIGDCVKSKYKCTIATLTQVGDELSFLKRRHMWIRDGVLGIVPNPKHIDTLCGLLGVAHQKPKHTPFPTGGTASLGANNCT